MDNSNDSSQNNPQKPASNSQDSQTSSDIQQPYQDLNPPDTDFEIGGLQYKKEENKVKPDIPPPPPWKGKIGNESKDNREKFVNFSPAPTDTGHIISAHQQVPKDSKNYFKTTLLISFIIALIVGLTAGGYFLYNYIYDPIRVIEKSVTNIQNAKSFSADVAFNTQDTLIDINVKADLQNSDYEYSRVQLDIQNIFDEVGHNLVVLLVFNSIDMFINTNYLYTPAIDAYYNTIFPEVAQFDSYKLIKILLTGEKWLHIKSEELNAASGEGVSITKSQEENISEKFANAIVVKSYDRNFSKNDKNYYKITVGFDKEKLIEFVNSFKDLDLDIQLKDINALVKIVNATDGWNSELIEILIDKETGYLESISVSIPNIPDGALEQSLDEAIEEESGGITNQLYGVFESTINDIIEEEDKEENKINYIGTVTLSNYNSAPAGERPEKVIELQELTNALNNEAPIISQLLLFPLLEKPQDLPPVYGDFDKIF